MARNCTAVDHAFLVTLNECYTCSIYHTSATPHVIPVQLSSAQPKDVIVYFELTGTAALGWNYLMRKPRPRPLGEIQEVKIKAGKTKARIALSMLDQSYVPDHAETIHVTLHVEKLKEQGVVVDPSRGVFNIDILDKRKRPKKFAYHDEL